jgi:hypothetical protein
LLETMRTTAQKIKDGKIEAALREAGYTWIHQPPYGKIWLPPGYPNPGSRFGFVPQGEENK